MAPSILFEEVQQFRQKWVEGILLFANTVLLLCYFTETFVNENPSREARVGLLSALAVCGAITFLIKRIKLITQITPEGIQVRFSPLQRRFQFYSWSDIEQLFIRTYNPLLEYGGWGLRLGPSGSAYNVSGNVGLQIVLRGNFRILIGTEKPELLIEALHTLGRI